MITDLSNKKVGDKVFDALGGEWRVAETNPLDVYMLVVAKGDLRLWVTHDGRSENINTPPSFFSEPLRVIPAQGECDFSGYQVGDEVYDRDGFKAPILEHDGTHFGAGRWGGMRINGKDYAGKQLVFHAPPHLVPSNTEAFRIPQHIAERKNAVDWSQVPIDTLVQADTVSGTHLRYFAGLRDGKLTYWRFGASSLTVEDDDEWGVAYNMRLAKDGTQND